MKIRIIPTQELEKLKQNLAPRVEDIEVKNGEIIVETDKEGLIERTPGVKKYYVEGQEKLGIKGKPITKKAYAKLNSEKDAVRCLIATQKGYDLVMLNPTRSWDYRKLKEYNPNIRKIKSDNPIEELEINHATFPHENLEEIDIGASEEEMKTIYRNMLT